MSPTAGMMLVSQIVPLIAAAVAKGAVRGIGCEDVEELTAEGTALAAKALDSAERRGKAVPPQSVAWYAVENLKQGRRSGYAGQADVMSAAATVCGRVTLRSLDEPMAGDGDNLGTAMTLHDVLASAADDVDVAAARNLDWDLVIRDLDPRRHKVLKRTAAGYGTDEIASELQVSPPAGLSVAGVYRALHCQGVGVEWDRGYDYADSLAGGPACESREAGDALCEGGVGREGAWIYPTHPASINSLAPVSDPYRAWRSYPPSRCQLLVSPGLMLLLL